MYFDGNNKVLFVVGMDQGLERLLLQTTNVKPENMFLLQIYGPEISQPFGELMRDILVVVYQEEIDTICVVGTHTEKGTVDICDLRNKIREHDGVKEKAKTMDYLFKYCMPEFPGVTVSEWLAGSQTVIEGIQNSVKILRNHPLLPSNLKVHGLMLDKETAILSKIQVSQELISSL